MSLLKRNGDPARCPAQLFHETVRDLLRVQAKNESLALDTNSPPSATAFDSGPMRPGTAWKHADPHAKAATAHGPTASLSVTTQYNVSSKNGGAYRGTASLVSIDPCVTSKDHVALSKLLWGQSGSVDCYEAFALKRHCYKAMALALASTAPASVQNVPATPAAAWPWL